MKYLKYVKYVESVLIIYALYINGLAIYVVYKYFNFVWINHPIPSNIFYVMLGSILFIPIIYIIAYLVSLVLINKNKSIGYLISGIVSFLMFTDGINQLVKNNIHYDWSMVPTSLFWVSIIVISFWARIKLKKD